VPKLAVAAVAGVLAGAMLGPVAASARGSVAWTGGGDGSSWSDGLNWSGNQPPQTGDSVTIAPTASEPTPHVTGMPSGTQLQDLTLTDASLSGGDVDVMGTFSWSASHGFETLASPLTVEGDASFGGAGELDSQDPMTFLGNTDIAGPGLLSIQDSGTAIDNSGTFTLEPGAAVRASVCCVTPDVFVNTGTISMPASTAGTASLSFMEFNDQGSVSVGPGSLLDVTGGPGEFSATSDISGGGTLQFELGAKITLAAGVSIGAGSTVALTGNAEFFGPGSFAGGGKFSWSGGTVDGNLTLGSTIHTTISGTATKSFTSPGSTHAVLSFQGPTTVQGSGPLEAFAADIASSGALTVKPGATVEGNACCTSPDEFLNTGTLTVPGTSGSKVSLAGMLFNDQGTVVVSAGKTLIVTVGPGGFSPGVTFSGGGTVEFDKNASMTLASNMSIQSGTTLTLTGGATFTGPGSFTGSGNFAWSGGTINGNLDVASTIDTTISGTATKSLTSPGSTPTALTLHGATDLKGAGEVELFGTTTLSNQGTLTMGKGTTVGASVCCVTPDHFTNAGTLTVTAGSGTATTTNLAFSNSGTVKVSSGTLTINSVGYKQTAGATQLAGGSVSAAKTITISGGTLSGFGTITGSMHNGGTVSPSTTGGVLTISGTYTQTSAGVLTSVITGTTPGTKFGQLSVGGHATLAGTLKVNTGGGFTPSHGEAFSVLLYHAHSGTFGTLSGSPAYSVSYTATAAKVVYP
jgi:fibronectin-binding autotransporter adhesin